MVRTSGPARTCVVGLALTRAWSLSGTGSIQSISPESSAATRVAALGIGVNTTSSTFPVGLSHQFGFFFQTVFTPGSWLTRMKGPVPLACSPAKGGVVAFIATASVAPWASDQFLENMVQV